MSLSKNMEKAINDQINAELWSAYFYLSMSAYFESINLPGFANWMRVQYEEETFHALKFFTYVNERGGRVILAPIDSVETTWDSAKHVFQETYKHEQKVTGLINNLIDISIEENDHATNNMLQWFIAEQVEEEATVDAILNQLKMLEDNKFGLLMLDKEFAQRAFKAPAE